MSYQGSVVRLEFSPKHNRDDHPGIEPIFDRCKELYSRGRTGPSFGEELSGDVVSISKLLGGRITSPG